MKYSFLFLTLISFWFSSCSTKKSKDLTPFLVNVSEFSIDTSALIDGTEIEVLGASNKLNNSQKYSFYNLIVVRNIKTDQVVNILCANTNKLISSKKNRFFVSSSSLAGKIFDHEKKLTKKTKMNVLDLKNIKFDKVFYDTEFIIENVRDNPTVIGNLLDYYSVNKQNSDSIK